jgi:uncharacterized membrane protein
MNALLILGGFLLIMTATVMLYADVNAVFIFIGDLLFGIIMIANGVMYRE